MRAGVVEVGREEIGRDGLGPLERVTNAEVQLASPPVRQPLVRHLADEAVTEPKPVRTERHEEPIEGGPRIGCRVCGLIDGVGEDREVHRHSEHRRLSQPHAFGGRHGVDAGHDQPLDRLRELTIGSVLDGGAGQLDEEQRIATAAFRERLDLGRPELVTRGLPHQLAGRRPVEGTQLDDDRRPETGETRGAGTPRQHDHPGLRRGAGGELRQQLARSLVDPVRVLDHQGDGVLRDADYRYVTQAADALRRAISGDVVRYVVNRNINYTNICTFRCKFCAFSKGRTHDDLRGSPYDLDIEEITRRAIEAWDRGATEVCLQGGIHPDYTGATYEAICRAIKAVVPEMHIHAFSALEVTQGAATLGLPIHAFLARLKAAGLGTLPGTAAEILDDEIRAIICPDKINTGQWLDVQRAAHRAGLRTTSTIMYGHVETSRSWAKHLLALRDLQAETGGFTEFVPLPFVHMEAPMYRLGMARPGPTFREAVLMHSIGRLALHPLISNIQTSWVKMGPAGAAVCLKSGANDLGGTLMNESISRAAGTQHGQEFPPHEMEALIRSIGREPMQRDTLYRPAPEERRAASMIAADLEPIVLTPPRRKAAVG